MILLKFENEKVKRNYKQLLENISGQKKTITVFLSLRKIRASLINRDLPGKQNSRARVRTNYLFLQNNYFPRSSSLRIKIKILYISLGIFCLYNFYIINVRLTTCSF